jgi:hypothetical protein
VIASAIGSARQSLDVAQICNLPYRRISFCGTLPKQETFEIFNVSRLQVGPAGAGAD